MQFPTLNDLQSYKLLKEVSFKKVRIAFFAIGATKAQGIMVFQESLFQINYRVVSSNVFNLVSQVFKG